MNQLSMIAGPSYMNPTRKQKVPFTPQEDQIINYFVSLIGVRNWTFIEKYVPGRSAKQCRDRYMNYLKPGLSNIEWTQAEDEILLQLYKKFGPKWATINKFFKNRNQISLKNRFTFLKRFHLFPDKKAYQNNINDIPKFDQFKKEEKIPSENEKPHDITNNKFINEAINVKNDNFIFNFDNIIESDDDFSSFSLFKSEDDFTF